MKKLISILAAALLALPLTAQNYSAQAGVSFFTGAPATVTQTVSSRLPTFSGTGTLTITEAGITGSPSGCSVTLAYQGNNAPTVGAVVSTTSFTPSTGTQTFVITPSQLNGDNYVAVFACSTYPTAGTITASFSPSQSVSVDPCFVSPKSSASVAISTATTTSLVALAAGKSVYVCGFTATVGASSTVQLEYGTGAACVTTQTALTGVMAPATGGIIALNGDGTKVTAPAGNAVCAVSTGTGGINGTINYVQQ